MAVLAQAYVRPEDVYFQGMQMKKQGQEEIMLDTFIEYIVSRRKKTWCQQLEFLMQETINSCIKFKRHDMLQLTIDSYKKFTQQHNSDSLQHVLQAYLTTVEKMWKDDVVSKMSLEKILVYLSDKQKTLKNMFFNMHFPEKKQNVELV